MYAWGRAVLPFADADVEVHPKGLIFLPHERLRVRLNTAFGAGFYKFLPVGDPVVGGREVIWRFRLSFRDGSEAEAVGHAEFIKNNPDYSYGDVLETCSSDAFTRCCKSCGIGLQVWNRDYQIMYMQRYAVRVKSTKTGKWQWRRKDRPAIPYERLSRDQAEPDYVPRESLDQENRKHLESINPSPAAQRFDKQLRAVSKEEEFYDPDDDEQLRRLHEMEESLFRDDAREDT